MQIDQEQKTRLTQAVMRLLKSWQLPSEAQIALLGLPAGARKRSVRKFQQGGALPDGEQTWERVDHLIGIADALRTSYPAHPEFGSIWIKQRNRKLRGRTPLDCMLEDGMPGFVQVRSHLDCAWSWQRDEEYHREW
ncbi:MAG: antitoxin Xre/MbcA/ParS toxin-binding domain-containing protein [Pseudomonadota bacterium]|nr:antitoxin Xre/MbcA/ParS toxin-binding domain-containing protein [Pseudomonadota bacterium]